MTRNVIRQLLSLRGTDFSMPSVTVLRKPDNYWRLKYFFQHLSYIFSLFMFFYR